MRAPPGARSTYSPTFANAAVSAARAVPSMPLPFASQLMSPPSATHQPGASADIDEASRSIAEGRRAGIRPARDAAVVAGAVRPLAQLDPAPARALVGDLHPPAAGEAELARVDEPARGQHGTVDVPGHGPGDRVEEVPVPIVPAAGSRGAGGAGGCRRLRRRRGRAPRSAALSAARWLRRGASPRGRRSARRWARVPRSGAPWRPSRTASGFLVPCCRRPRRAGRGTPPAWLRRAGRTPGARLAGRRAWGLGSRRQRSRRRARGQRRADGMSAPAVVGNAVATAGGCSWQPGAARGAAGQGDVDAEDGPDALAGQDG